MKPFSLLVISVCLIAVTTNTAAQAVASTPQSLSQKQQTLVVISALAGKGEWKPLHTAMNEGFTAGWTVNELKEAMVHLYAYAGFPRSLNGLGTLKAVVDERTAKGLKDEMGKETSLLLPGKTDYEAGTELQAKLLGKPTKTAIADFAPVIDTFLKAHLFGDIFRRDILNFQARELITVSTLAGLGNADAQLQAHIGVSLYNGLTEAQLAEWALLIRANVGSKEGKTATDLLQAVLRQRQGYAATNKADGYPATAIAPTKSGMLVRISEIEIYADSLAQYKTILKDEAEASVRLEPGVISIFPMYQQKDSTQIRILEIYADREAYESHLKTPHFLRYKTTTLKMVKSLRLVDMNALDAATMPVIFSKLKKEKP